MRWGALGDMVLITPLLRALAQRHGAPCEVVCLGAWVPALFRGLPSVGGIHAIGSRKTPYWMSPEQWRLKRTLAGLRGHPFYLLAGDADSGALARRAGMTVTASIHGAGHVPNEHQVDNQARVAGFPAAGYDRRPQLVVGDDERAACRAWLGALVGDAPVVLLHAGNKKTMGWRRRGGDLKSWPVERWAAVARGVLAHQPRCVVLLTGAPGERQMTDHIVAAVGDPRCRSIAGETPLRRLLALLTIAHSTISVDTGPAHAAAALGCPLTVLFGATDPRINGPVPTTAPVAIVTGPEDAPVLDGEAAWAAHHHMEAIGADAVLAAWRGMALG
jgi:heptosyltransferase-2/heptosyltransferase-3